MALTVEQALQQGIAAHKEGKLREAERLYRAILQSQPTHPDANHNLGALAVSLNKADTALPLFKTALGANPKIEQFWLSYIDALFKEKQFDDAKRVLKQAKQQGVNADRLSSLEAQLSPKTQNPNTVSISPPQELLNSLLAHYQNGRLNDAETLAGSITNEFPQHQFAWQVLGAVLKQTGRVIDSLKAMQKSAQLAPQDGDSQYNLGNTLKELGRLEEALASYNQAIALKPDFPDAHYNLGNTLQALGILDKAEASYNQAIALKPDYAEAHNNLGTTLQELGRFKEALDGYRQAIALKPGYAEAHRHLASMKKFDAQDEQYSKMLELYLDKNISEEQRCHINFGLAKACEDLANFEQAFMHYSEGNAIRKKLLNYDINQDVELFKQLKSSYPKIEQHILETDNISKNLIPIFIIGMPRSGTTLVEQIISSHLQVTGGGELNFANQFGAAIATGTTEPNPDTLLEFRHKYLDKIKNVSNGNFIVTDKMPQNFRYVGLLAAAFPEAKIVHVKRNPAAVCWSNYKQHFSSKSIGYCYSIEDVINYYKLYKNLMEFWVNTLETSIYELDYERLTINQENETGKLIEHLNLEWDENCLSPQNNTRRVATASNAQVRQKVYQGSSEQWKKYQPFLNGALDSLLSESTEKTRNS